MNGIFNNSLSLVKFILRRERIISTVWIVLLVSTAVSLAASMDILFDAPSRHAFLETLNSPAMISMMGPLFGHDNFHSGAMYSVCMVLWLYISVGVMNIFIVVRHTRADEERGRTEVIRSLPTGRLANLNAVFISAALINAILGLLTGVGVRFTGTEGFDFAGSLIFGLMIFAVGLFFAAMTAVFCQLSSNSRGALGWSFLSLGVLYFLRAAGDITPEIEFLSYISTLGLSQRAKIFVDNNWIPFFIILIETVVLAAVAFWLNSIRDMDQGIIPAKRGRAEAKKNLSTPFGLAVRLLKGPLIAWLIIIFVFSAAYASVLGDIDAFIESSEFYQLMIGMNPDFPITELFAAMANNIMLLLCLVPVISAALKPRAEEQDGRAENILARVVSRRNYLSGYVIIAFVSSLLLVLANAFGLHLTASAIPGVNLSFEFILKANLVYLPALWVMIGLTVLLVGLLPKASTAVWGYYGFTFFTSFIGRTLNLPDWITGLTPFFYVPQLPVDEISWLPLSVMTAVAAVLTAAGFYFYSKREMVFAV